MRTEHDMLWSRELPDDTPRGIYTARVLDNYPQDGIWSIPSIFLRIYIQAKMVYASVNARHNKISQDTADAIVWAGQQLLDMPEEEFVEYFPVRQVQSGGGTSTNMMINEVLANLATVRLWGIYGEYLVDPHNHVNASQSSNDTFPWVIKLVVHIYMKDIFLELANISCICDVHACAWADIETVSRTHLQDAVVIHLWDEFAAYTRTFHKNLEYIQQSIEVWAELNFWGTATWSLQNITPEMRRDLIADMSEVFGYSYIQPESYFEQNSSSGDLYYISQTLSHLASDCIKICNDLRLLSSGPLAGFGEIVLPQVQPWSSIMPGKVNPSILEAMTMVCARVIGNTKSVEVLTHQAQLQLQQFAPGIARVMIESLEYLLWWLQMRRSKCLAGITPNKEHIHKILEWSFAYATDYSETLWYEKVAELVQRALKEWVNLRALLEGEAGK